MDKHERTASSFEAEITAVERLLGVSLAENAELRKEVERLHAELDEHELFQYAVGIVMGRLDVDQRLALTLVTCIAALVVAAGAFGASNPNGTGQPSQSCQAEPTGPPGITSTTKGFATKAVNVYAGSPGTESAEANAHAVSQYDVACLHVSQH